ncbi:hypothetical protein JNB62_15835 [Microbacterium jejuense]|uniref:Uncharacterized protein n=1 Tax=Microbacterium jejuense TaxID=1263637 RepID=A0ABS7HSI2_9MICO|nr:hypothetical protein [Microbacterium jejuense]MBW9095157.1 hypothetical protein [Microbacterium jejuense]
MSARTAAPRPRPLVARPRIGDVVQVGRVRWIIQNLRGEHVELEASNVTPRVWWTTTLAALPTES